MATFETSPTNSVEVSENHLSALRLGRVRAGVIYGVILGSIYALIAQVIDVWVLNDLPLHINWTQTGVLVGLTALSGAVLGGVTAWPIESWRGVLAGAVTITVWGLVKAMIELPSALLVLVLLPTLLPLVFLGLPIALLMRFVVNRHESQLQESGLRRVRGLGLLLVGVVAVAGFAGSWAQMPDYAQDAVRRVHRILQKTSVYPNDPLPLSLRDVPRVRNHLSEPYTLSQHPAASSPTGIEVGVLFNSGYTLTCLIDSAGALPICFEGSNLFEGPAMPAGDQ